MYFEKKLTQTAARLKSTAKPWVFRKNYCTQTPTRHSPLLYHQNGGGGLAVHWIHRSSREAPFKLCYPWYIRLTLCLQIPQILVQFKHRTTPRWVGTIARTRVCCLGLYRIFQWSSQIKELQKTRIPNINSQRVLRLHWTIYWLAKDRRPNACIEEQKRLLWPQGSLSKLACLSHTRIS